MFAEYSGDHYFPVYSGFDDLDLRLNTLDLNLTMDASAALLITSPENNMLAPIFSGLRSVILGDDENTHDASAANGTQQAISEGGHNTLIGGGGTNYLSSLGGNALLQGGSGINYLMTANGNDTIIGGTGPNVIMSQNNGFVGVTAPDGTSITLADAPGFNTITDGPGDDQISAMRGDRITLTDGANRIEITGYSPADFWPTVISGFDPRSDSFEYRVAIAEQ
ncbi:MAG: hypothetical protein ACK4HW_02355 [Roseinatronobacter sp.]